MSDRDRIREALASLARIIASRAGSKDPAIVDLDDLLRLRDHLTAALDDPGDRKNRASFLSTSQIQALHVACLQVTEALGHHPYLVGSAITYPHWRDVDIRSIIPDDEFDALFGGREQIWGLFSFAVSGLLSAMTGLPVDYQVQRMTQANTNYPDGERHALGFRAHTFAGAGDATPFREPKDADGGR